MSTADVVRRVFDIASRRDSQPFRYRFSSAGEMCLRALVYDAHDADDGKPQAEGKSELAWVLSSVCGTAIGNHLERAAVAAGGFARQVFAEFDTGAVWIRGDADLADRETVYDWKLVGEKKWKRVQKKPDDKHVMQINGYAVALDRPRWSLIYIRAASIFEEGATTPDVKIHDGEASVEGAQALCGVWEQVDRHRKLRTLPERVFGAHPEKFPCGWCRHLSRCSPSPEEGVS